MWSGINPRRWSTCGSTGTPATTLPRPTRLSVGPCPPPAAWLDPEFRRLRPRLSGGRRPHPGSHPLGLGMGGPVRERPRHRRRHRRARRPRRPGPGAQPSTSRSPCWPLSRLPSSCSPSTPSRWLWPSWSGPSSPPAMADGSLPGWRWRPRRPPTSIWPLPWSPCLWPSPRYRPARHTLATSAPGSVTRPACRWWPRLSSSSPSGWWSATASTAPRWPSSAPRPTGTGTSPSHGRSPIGPSATSSTCGSSTPTGIVHGALRHRHRRAAGHHHRLRVPADTPFLRRLLGLAFCVYTFQTILYSETREVLVLFPFFMGMAGWVSGHPWRERFVLAASSRPPTSWSIGS